MNPTALENRTDYERIAKAICFIAKTRLEQPGLDEIAAHVGLSPHHFQRLFSRWAGVSPKKFLGYLTLQHARALLAEDTSVLDTALDIGLSGPSRLHDLFVSFEAMTPGEYKSGGAGLTISYAVHTTPFGPAVVMKTPLGVCGLEFLDPDQDVASLVRARWPGANIIPAQNEDDALISRLFGDSTTSGDSPIRLHVKGTNFQIRVWEALLKIPSGHATTYKRIAHTIGADKAARAVGGAVGANPVGVLIPCHRVIKESGVVEGYRWGSTRKHALLAWESAHMDGTKLDPLHDLSPR